VPQIELANPTRSWVGQQFVDGLSKVGGAIANAAPTQAQGNQELTAALQQGTPAQLQMMLAMLTSFTQLAIHSSSGQPQVPPAAPVGITPEQFSAARATWQQNRPPPPRRPEGEEEASTKELLCVIP